MKTYLRVLLEKRVYEAEGYLAKLKTLSKMPWIG
jgi:hypothetical protein